MDTNSIERAATSAPKPEATQSKELLNKDHAGLQASLVLDGLKWAPGKKISEKDLRDVQTKIKDKSFKTEKITNGSNLERDEYWNGVNSEYKGQSYNEQMAVWKDKTKKFIEGRSDEEKEVLKRLGWEAENVDVGYKDYFGFEKDGGHNGDVAYFAKKVADTLSRDEINKYTKSGLLEEIGGFYGKDSAKVARLLTEGVKNLEEETFDEFAKEAVSQFNAGLGTTENDLIDKVYERSEKWVKDQKQKEDAKKAEEEAEKKRKEAERKEKEKKTDEGQPEKEIRGLMVPLTKFDEDIKKKATEEKFDFGPNFKFVDNFTGDQIKRIKETEWGKVLIGEYQKKFDLVNKKITEAIEAKNAKFEEIKIGELKDGDIFREKGKDEQTLIFEGKGKKIIEGAEKDVYKYNVIGKGFEFFPRHDITEENSEGVVLQKLVFGVQAQKSEGDPKNARFETKTPEVIAKEIDGAIEKYNKSGSKIIKEFVPVLESLKGDHASIPEEDYQNFVKRVLGGFLLACGLEDSGKEKEQLMHLIGSFDLVYAHHNELMSVNTNPWLRRYYEERINKFEELLKKEDVKKAENAVGKKFDESIMNKLSEKEVEEDRVGIVLDESIPGFTWKGEHLRRSSVVVGKRKVVDGNG